jgi:hypothetical protein
MLQAIPKDVQMKTITALFLLCGAPVVASPLEGAKVFGEEGGRYTIEPAEALDYFDAYSRVDRYWSNALNPARPAECGKVPADVEDTMWKMFDEVGEWRRQWHGDAQLALVLGTPKYAPGALATICGSLAVDLETLGIRSDWVGMEVDPVAVTSFIPKDQYEEVKVYSMLENNDCNWHASDIGGPVDNYHNLWRYEQFKTSDFETYYEKSGTEYDRVFEGMDGDSMAVSEAIFAAQDEGYVDATTDSKLTEVCPIIDAYAASQLKKFGFEDWDTNDLDTSMRQSCIQAGAEWFKGGFTTYAEAPDDLSKAIGSCNRIPLGSGWIYEGERIAAGIQ